jgi:hypothetical protein
MTYLTADRRVTRRRHLVQEHGIVRARVRPGHMATVVDVSAGGVLVETEHRLLPGSSVELQLESDNRSEKLRGRVVRCSVSRVRPEAVSYRGAIAFDRQLPWFDEGDGYDVPNVEKRSGTGFRAPDTRGVV